MPGRFQPRRTMDEGALDELVSSIHNQGVISPIVVRQTGEKQYEIIAGERRWQAAKRAGLTTIPAVVRPLSDQAAMVIGLIENIQREQLSALEEAQAFSRLLLEFKMTHEDVANAVGKSRTAVTNTMRLLQLATGAKTLLEEGKIHAGHARALLSLPKDLQSSFAKKIAGDQLSVRQTEQMVQKYLSPKEVKPAKERSIDPDVEALEQRLSDRLATKVSIQYDQKGAGTLQVRFNSLAQLDDILAIID
jgi:ParB family chromosome partitioning protein